MRGLNAVRTSHFNIFNHSENSFFTPGAQLANIAGVKPDAPAIVYVSPKNIESVMTWRTLETLSNRIAWYLLEQGIGAGKSVILLLLLASGKRAPVTFPYLTEFHGVTFLRYVSVFHLPLW